MTECCECLRALQRVVHKVYADDCEACVIRRIAYLPLEERESCFDAVERKGGLGDRSEAIRLVTLERARIAALSEAMPKKERA